MNKDLDLLYLIQYVEDKIQPYTLNSIGKNNLSVLNNEFNVEDLKNAIDISYKNYIKLDDNGEIMNTFRELGNLSAHKIWYNSTKKDIEILILRYRAMIEELLYKSKIIN